MKKIIFTQNLKENPKIIVKITAIIKKAIKNVKKYKKSFLLRTLRRIQNND